MLDLIGFIVETIFSILRYIIGEKREIYIKNAYNKFITNPIKDIFGKYLGEILNLIVLISISTTIIAIPLLIIISLGSK